MVFEFSRQVLATVLEAVAAFVATNIDELIVLVTFFARALTDPEFTVQHILLGQFIGFTIILLLSLLGGSVGWLLPLRFIALIGLIPLAIGCHQLYGVVRFWYKKWTRSRRTKIIPPTSLEEGSSLLTSTQVYGTTTPTRAPAITTARSPDVMSDASDDSVLMHSRLADLGKLLCHTNVVFITAVLLADGTEEITIFASLFSTFTIWQTCLTVLIFYSLLVGQCLLAYEIVNWHHVASMVSRYSKNVMPFLLIGLGVYVLRSSVLWSYLVRR